MVKATDWTREEVVIALKLYSDLSNPQAILRVSPNTKGVGETAMILSARPDGNHRRPTSVSSKILNLARFDQRVLDIGKVWVNGSKVDEQVWKEFHDRNGTLMIEALEKEYEKIIIQSSSIIEEGEIDIEEQGLAGGYEILLPRKVRVNQGAFRTAVLENYGKRCCITHIDNANLLVASHIRPWKDCTGTQRTDPGNGLCLNGLHDRAFDRGLMTVNTDYTIEFADSLRNEISADVFEMYFRPFEGTAIELPSKYMPKRKYLEYHNKHIFQCTE